jgi:hypothetical protein
MSDSAIPRIIAAQHLSELLRTSMFGDLLHRLGDVDALDLAQKLASRIGEIARAEVDAAEAKK